MTMFPRDFHNKDVPFGAALTLTCVSSEVSSRLDMESLRHTQCEVVPIGVLSPAADYG